MARIQSLGRKAPRRWRLLMVAALAAAVAAMVAVVSAPSGSVAATAQTSTLAPVVRHDVKTGYDALGTIPVPPGQDPIQDYVQPDTQIEPSIAVNPENPENVVTVYQEGRIADGGDATNGYATSFDGGATWEFGELPGLTTFPGQGGEFERASDAVVAFGPNNIVYANSLVFDFNKDEGLRSGIAINVSKDGGRTWSDPVILQDDDLGGTNDKNWIVVDMSHAAGHHFGRVYVVWDRIAPVVYDYCDAQCDKQSNWLPNLQTIPGLIFPGQGIGAYPVITKGGGLGIVMDTLTGGIPVPPSNSDEPDVEPGDSELVFIGAPAAGATPYPAPLTFLPPVDIASNQSAGTPAQRASEGLPAAAVDPDSGAIYAVWDDSRYRKDGTNDAVISLSTDDGLTWSTPSRVNRGAINRSTTTTSSSRSATASSTSPTGRGTSRAPGRSTRPSSTPTTRSRRTAGRRGRARCGSTRRRRTRTTAPSRARARSRATTTRSPRPAATRTSCAARVRRRLPASAERSRRTPTARTRLCWPSGARATSTRAPGSRSSATRADFPPFMRRAPRRRARRARRSSLPARA
jgi:hypothetical protein